MEINKIIQGDSLEILKTIPPMSVDCVITSPPYWMLRDYGVEGQFGLEPTYQEYINKLCGMFDEVKRVLKSEGTCWVNLGDCYSSDSSYSEGGRQGFGNDKIGMMNKSKGQFLEATDTERMGMKGGRLKGGKSFQKKSLIMIPERFAIEMMNRGWILRNKIIWHKNNAMPSSVLDRLTNKYEIVYFFTKNTKYHFDIDAIRIPFTTEENRPEGIVRERTMGYNSKLGTKQRNMEEDARKFGSRRPPSATNEYVRNPLGKNPGDVWTLNLQPNKESHIAMFPEKLISPMILAGSPKGGLVLDIFMGAGTTAVVAKKLGRNYLGIELNPEYVKISEERILGVTPPMF